MAEKKRTLELLDRAYRAKAWHGPALLETLDGVDASMAARRVVKGAHTIWELVDHLGSWNAIVAERLAGKTPQVTPDMNFPRTPSPTAAAWKKALARRRGFAAEVPRRGGEVPRVAARPHPARHQDVVERAHPRPDAAPALSRRPDRDAPARHGSGDQAVVRRGMTWTVIRWKGSR